MKYAYVLELLVPKPCRLLHLATYIFIHGIGYKVYVLYNCRCLEQVADIIERYRQNDTPVAGIIVEPIQSEGGDHEASPEFFQSLQQLCKQVRTQSKQYSPTRVLFFQIITKNQPKLKYVREITFSNGQDIAKYWLTVHMDFVRLAGDISLL